METTPDRRRGAYWRKVRLLTKVLLAAWFFVTFGVIFFARELSHVTVLGWPLSFYMAAQGIVLVYLLIVAVHVWAMRRLDSELLNGKAHG
jgi:putative solute:sodium symporter small subunit